MNIYKDISVQPLLSICIPTFNRCDTLDSTLFNLFSNADFNPKLIEVIVSDNCSTDQTNQVVAKYPLVKYFFNTENIRDFNFSKALGYANGHYIKLFNDTLSFRSGELAFILDIISKNLDRKTNIFFYQNSFINQNCTKRINSAQQFVENVSYGSTWIANFGAWNTDFEEIRDKDLYAPFQFVQVGWSYALVNNSKESIIYFRDFFEIATPSNKGGYNVFDTFINKYLYVLKKQRLPLISYQVEKYRLLRYFVLPWIKLLSNNKDNKYSYDVNGVYTIILRKYWYALYVYPFLLLNSFKRVKK